MKTTHEYPMTSATALSRRQVLGAAFSLGGALMVTTVSAHVARRTVTAPLRTHLGETRAYRHLKKVMDQFHNAFDVSTDFIAAGNHFAARCAIVRNPDSPLDVAGVAFDEAWTQQCHSGATCIRNTLIAVDSKYWGGWYFQNGVLLADDTQPRCNWGTYADSGVDLTGATKLIFWARGETGHEWIEFFVGGVGWDPETEEPTAPHHDSFRRVPPLRTLTRLTTEWQQ
jgi:hypothetical protein